MSKTRSAGWIGGTAVLIVGILVATYFLLYLPRADEAAATLSMAEETNSRNDILEVEVAGLAAKADNLSVYTDALDELSIQIPADAALAQFTEMVRSGAGQFSVLLEEVSPGVPITVTVPTPVAETPAAPTAPTEGGDAPGSAGTAIGQAEETAGDAEASADAHDDTDTGTGAPVAPTGPQQVEGLVAVPVTIKALGSYGNVLAYVEYLQERPGRLFLLSDLDAIRQKATPATQAKPAIADGDLEVTIVGYFYVLRDTLGLADVLAGLEGDVEQVGDEPSEEPTEEPTEEPMPNSPNNPFVPLVPTAHSAG